MKRVIAGLLLGCEIGAYAGFGTAVFLLGALFSGNRYSDYDPVFFWALLLGGAGASFVVGLLVGISIVIEQDRQASADKAPTKCAAENGPDRTRHCS